MNSDNKKEPINSSIKKFLIYKIQLDLKIVNPSYQTKWGELKTRLEKLLKQAHTKLMKENVHKTIELITKLQNLRADIRGNNNDY